MTGLNGFTKRLRQQGYRYDSPAQDGTGKIYKNAAMGEEVRIHRSVEHSPDHPGKTTGTWYYRYRTGGDQSWSEAVPLQGEGL